MSKIILEIDKTQIESAVEKMSVVDKIELARKLEKMTMNKRIDNLLNKIDARSKKNPISQREIDRVIKETRKELYGESGR